MWLSGWNKRIKLTIDHTKIDAALTYFPVTLILSSSHGDCIFDELGSDANRKKIAFTESDGTTQLYGEIEKWDDANESAVIHVSASGWTIDPDTDTDLYMYYDSEHADNSTYIGDIDSTPGATVWDSNFQSVCHMTDATTSTVKDSTSNSTDGTKKGANEPSVTTGKVGQAQDFDGANDYISMGNVINVGANGLITMSAIVRADAFPTSGNLAYILGKGYDGTYEAYFLRVYNDAGTLKLTCGSYHNPYNHSADWTVSGWNTGEYHSLGATYDGTTWRLYFDGVEKVTSTTDGPESNSRLLLVGAMDHNGTPQRFWDGIIDSVQVSSTNRSAAWITATYNSLFDTLLTYGGEEIASASFIPLIMFF